MNSVDFWTMAIGLLPEEIIFVMSRDDLQCTNEDQVVNFILEYMVEKE